MSSLNLTLIIPILMMHYINRPIRNEERMGRGIHVPCAGTNSPSEVLNVLFLINRYFHVE